MKPKKLKKNREIPDDAIIQLQMSLEALRKGKVSKFQLPLKHQ